MFQNKSSEPCSADPSCKNEVDALMKSTNGNNGNEVYSNKRQKVDSPDGRTIQLEVTEGSLLNLLKEREQGVSGRTKQKQQSFVS